MESGLCKSYKIRKLDYIISYLEPKFELSRTNASRDMVSSAQTDFTPPNAKSWVSVPKRNRRARGLDDVQIT